MERTSETLTIEEVIEINRQQIEMFGGLFLPVNNFHNGPSLEFALDTVDAVSFGQVLYPTLQDKAAHLTYSIIAGYVFHDGNKRTAIAACRVFLLLNGYDLQIESISVDEGAMEVALGVADSIIGRGELAEWIYERMVPIG